MIPPAPLNGNLDHDFALQMIAHHWVRDKTQYSFERRLPEKRSQRAAPISLCRHQ